MSTSVFAQVPQELIHEISTYLDTNDFLDLRRTSKELNSKFQDIHRKSIFESRSLYYNVPASYDNLLAIANHPSGMNALVRKITIRTPSPYCYERDIDEWHKFLEESSSGRKVELEFIRRLIEAIEAATEEISTFRESGTTYIPLRAAIGKFPNLKIVKFKNSSSKGPSIRRDLLNLFFPFIGLKPGKRVPEWMHGTLISNFVPDDHFDEDIINEVLDVLSKSSRTVEEISSPNYDNVTAGYFVDMQSSRLRRHQEAFKSLLRIRLTVQPWRDRNLSQNVCAPFFNWVSTIGEHLVDVDIGFPEKPVDSDDFYENDEREDRFLVIPALDLPSVRRLRLKRLFASLSNLRETIMNICERIEVLEFETCLMRRMAGDWYQIFQLIEAKCLNLRRFYFAVNSDGNGGVYNGDEHYESHTENCSNIELPKFTRPKIQSYLPRNPPAGSAGAPTEEPERTITLPGLEVNGTWNLPESRCRVTHFGCASLMVKGRKKYGTIGFVDLKAAIRKFKGAGEGAFWGFVSQGNWLDQMDPDMRLQITRFKYLGSSDANYSDGDEELNKETVQNSIENIKVEDDDDIDGMSDSDDSRVETDQASDSSNDSYSYETELDVDEDGSEQSRTVSEFDFTEDFRF